MHQCAIVESPCRQPIQGTRVDGENLHRICDRICYIEDHKHTWKAEAFLAETVAALKVVALEAGFMATLRAATTGAETIAEAIATIVIVNEMFYADQAQNVMK